MSATSCEESPAVDVGPLRDVEDRAVAEAQRAGRLGLVELRSSCTMLACQLAAAIDAGDQLVVDAYLDAGSVRLAELSAAIDRGGRRR